MLPRTPMPSVPAVHHRPPGLSFWPKVPSSAAHLVAGAGLLGDDVDDAEPRVGAVQHRVRPAHDLDALDVIQGARENGANRRPEFSRLTMLRPSTRTCRLELNSSGRPRTFTMDGLPSMLVPAWTFTPTRKRRRSSMLLAPLFSISSWVMTSMATGLSLFFWARRLAVTTWASCRKNLKASSARLAAGAVGHMAARHRGRAIRPAPSCQQALAPPASSSCRSKLHGSS